MPKPSRSKQPRDDQTNEVLFLFVDALLDDFLSEPGNRTLYQNAARGGDDETILLASIPLSDRGGARLTMRAGSPEITVTVGHPRFTAAIEAHYDPGDPFGTEPLTIEITGDRKTVRTCATKWFEELQEFSPGDIDELADALATGSADASPFEGQDDPGEPPPPSERDRAMVNALARALAREMKRKNPDMMAHQDGLLALEDCPQSLWPIVDGMIAACTATPRDDTLTEAWRFLLEAQLTLIRYRIESGWAWATRMAEEYQRKLLRIGADGVLKSTDILTMAGALGEARIEVKPEMRAALADVGLTPADDMPPAPLANMLRGLMNQMASFTSDPFDVASALGEATRVMPAELRSFMAHEFARSSHAVLRATVPLLLLSEEQEIRRTTAGALEQTAAPDTMSPESLRRMIAIRNWVPEADRPQIDQAIRKARLKGVECASWPPASDLMITASMIDGSGAQSILLTSRGGRKGELAGLLFKSSEGVADIWFDAEMSRRDINETLATLRKAGSACEISRAYLDVAVQNAIAIGAATGRPPGAALPRIAELCGGAEWRDRRLDVAAEATNLFDALPPEQRSPAAVEASLQRSGEWIEEGFAQSWFLDGADVREVVRRGPKRDTEAAARRVMDEVVPERRTEWAERFLLLALRAEAAREPAQNRRATDFLILAHEICENRTPVPLMAAIARHTVEVSRMARW